MPSLPLLFDFDHVPFSRAGRFLTLSMMDVPGKDGIGALYLRHVAGGDERPSLGRLCRVEFLDENGLPLAATFDLSPACLVARAGDGRAEFAIGEGETLHFRGAGLSVRFHLEGSRYDYVYQPPHGGHCLVAAVENVKIIPLSVEGDLDVTGTWQRDHSERVTMTFSGGAGFEGHLTLFRTIAPEPSAVRFEEARAGAGREFDAWLSGLPQALARQEDAHRLASYLLWANRVPA